MMNYRTITIAVVGLFLSLSFLASPVMAVEKDGVSRLDAANGRRQVGRRRDDAPDRNAGSRNDRADHSAGYRFHSLSLARPEKCQSAYTSNH